MRCSERVALLLLLATAACATPLPGSETQPPTEDAAAPLPVLTGCRPLQGLVQALSGGLRSVSQPGGVLAIADDAQVQGMNAPALQVQVPSWSPASDCLASAKFVSGAPTSALPSPLVPLAAVSVGGAVSLYANLPSGFGISALDPSSTPVPLWTSDRPAYGTAAVIDDANDAEGANVYAFGCIAARFLDGDCYLARAPASSLASIGAYEYYVGSERWSPRIEDAWPMTSGATAVDVAPLPSLGRWLMAYAGPLGTTIIVRSGLSPEGPWSAPIPVAQCDLADGDMFCVDVHLHPALAAPAGSIALSYAIASLSSDAAARQTQNPAAWWSRLAVLELPALP
jgi:hypothetical protein